MACEGYEHGSRVKVRKGILTRALDRYFKGHVTGVVVKVNHDKHRLSVNFAGTIRTSVDAHHLEQNTDPYANNLKWVLGKRTTISQIADVSDTSLAMLSACLNKESRPSRSEASRIVFAVNKLTKSKFALADVFPLEAGGKMQAGSTS
jgi:hypothetical protein